MGCSPEILTAGWAPSPLRQNAAMPRNALIDLKHRRNYAGFFLAVRGGSLIFKAVGASRWHMFGSGKPEVGISRGSGKAFSCHIATFGSSVCVPPALCVEVIAVAVRAASITIS